MKKLYLGLVVLLTGVFTTTVIAQEDNPFYVGADLSIGNLEGICIPSIEAILREPCEDNTHAYNLKVGYDINENVSIEGFYGIAESVELKIRSTVVNMITINTNADLDFDSVGIVLKGKYNAGGSNFLTGKIGFHNWESDYNVVAQSPFATAGATLMDSGTDLILGVGGSFDLYENFVADVGYNVLFGDAIDYKAFNFGVSYNF